MTKAEINSFCEYLNEQVNNHSIYVWGGQGEFVILKTLKDIERMENSKTNFRRVCNLVNSLIQRGVDISRSRMFDCSGLGVFWLLEMKLINHDMTANDMFKKCTEKPLNKIKKGDWVFKVNAEGKATHIGYVVDDSKSIVEAYGRDKGVIKAKLGNGSQFNRAGTFNG